ncbi:MAG: alpha/beta hydrolase [Pseudomonadota bacterium]
MSTFPEPRRIDCGDAYLSVHIAGSGPPVVLCHGFPDLALTWRHQIAPLVEAGYTVLAPDMRGYGGSDKPDGVSHYNIFALIGDLTGLLDHFGYEQAAFVGHDWGALLLWQMALLEPERIAALCALNIPFAPRRAVDPMVMTREVLGDDFYIVNFQDSDEADRAFDADPERFLRAMHRRLPTTRAAMESLPPAAQQPFSMLREIAKPEFPGEELFDPETLATYTEAFKRGGFTPPINWYRNWSDNWRRTEGLEQRVRMPTLFIGAVDDILISPAHVDTMRDYVDDLQVHMISDCGHWTQLEHPDALNALLTDWLPRRYPAR